MKRIAAVLGIASAVAACGPSTGMPLAAAQPPAVTVLWHAPVAGDADGHVFEYH